MLTAAGTAPMAAHPNSQPLLALALAAHGRDRAQAAGVARGGHSSVSSSRLPAAAAAAAAAKLGTFDGSEAESGSAAVPEKGILCFTRYLPNSNKRGKVSNDDISNNMDHEDIAATAAAAPITDCEWCHAPLPVVKVPKDDNGEQQRTREPTAARVNAIHANFRYCGWECAQAAALRSGSSSAIRRQVFALDRGVCALCRVDAHGHYLELQALTPPERFQRLLSGPFQSLLRTGSSSSNSTKKGSAANGSKAVAAPRVVMQPMEADFWQVRVKVRVRFWFRVELTFRVWDRAKGYRHCLLVCSVLPITLPEYAFCHQADHEVAVAEGGGACGLGNLRTLCTPCHRQETNALKQRLKRRSNARAAEVRSMKI